MAFAPPPSRIVLFFVAYLRNQVGQEPHIRFKRAEVGSMCDSRTVELEGVPGSMRSLMNEDAETA